jgi:hypothetical protein
MVFDQAPAAVTRRKPEILLETLRFPAMRLRQNVPSRHRIFRLRK